MRKSEISYRPGQDTDRDFLWKLHRETMMEYVDKTWGWDEGWQQERFDETFDPSSLQLMESEGVPIGYIRVERTTEEVFLAAIEITPTFQGRGIGSQLISDLIVEADGKRLPIRLQVLKANPRARQLYERLGFDRIEETDTHDIMRREHVGAV